jgi:hypothetical protein
MKNKNANIYIKQLDNYNAVCRFSSKTQLYCCSKTYLLPAKHQIVSRCRYQVLTWGTSWWICWQQARQGQEEPKEQQRTQRTCLNASGLGINITHFTSYTMLSERKSYPHKGLDMPQGLQEVQALRIFWQSAQDGRKVVSPAHWLPSPPREILGTHLIEA